MTEPIMEPAAARALGWALLHFLWQGSAIAGILALLRVVLPERAARLRYLAGCAALLAMLAAPAVTVALLHDGGAAPGVSAMSADVDEPAAAPALAMPAGALADEAVAAPGWVESAAAWLDPAIPWVLAAWLAGVCLLSLRLARGWVAARRIAERGCEPAAPRWLATLARLRRELGVSRPVRLAASALAEVPSVVGWLRPVVVVPVSVFAGLTTWQVEAILAHELAHIRRHDYLVNLLQSAVETLLFYHPATWWVSKQVREERERCCDDMAVALCGDAAGYVRALAELEAMRATPALALSATGGSLLGRARRLLAPSARRSSGTLAGAVALILVACAWATASAEQSQSFDSAPAMASMTPSTASAAMPLELPPAPTEGLAEGPTEGIVAPPPVPLSLAAEQASPPPDPPDPPDLPALPDPPAAPVGPVPVIVPPSPPSPPLPPVPPVPAVPGAAFTPPLLAAPPPGTPAPPRPPGRAGRRAAAADADEPDLIDVMIELGYTRIPVDQLIALGTHGVTRSFVLGMNGLGFGRLRVDTLIAMKIHGITPRFARDLRAAGVTISRADDLQAMKIHGITPDFVREAKRLGFRPLSPERLIALRIHGVLPRRRSR